MNSKNTHWVITFTPEEGLKVTVPSNGTLSLVENHPENEESDIMLSKVHGVRINFIRVLYTLCRLGYFTKPSGEKISDRQVFHIFGKMLNTDLSHYCNDLSRSMQDGNAYTKHIKVFEDMQKIMTDRFDFM